MKATLTTIALILVTLFSFPACQNADQVDKEKPAIEHVSFARIPVTDLKFDPKQRTITLQIPAVLPDGGLIPAFGLSENAKIVRGVTPTGKLDLSLIEVCKRADGTNREVEVIVANQAGTDSTVYRVVLVPPAGCPGYLERPAYYAYILQTSSDGQGVKEYHLPLKNAYQNLRIRSVQFIIQRAGVGTTTYEPDLAANPCLFRYGSDSPNRLVTTFGKDILSQYENWSEVSFTTDCDTNRVRFYRYY